MSDTPNEWSIEPQTVDDLITGLTFEFTHGADGVAVMRVTGDGVRQPREIRFPPSTREPLAPRDPFQAATN